LVRGRLVEWASLETSDYAVDEGVALLVETQQLNLLDIELGRVPTLKVVASDRTFDSFAVEELVVIYPEVWVEVWDIRWVPSLVTLQVEASDRTI
jgi:hypothetical protein